MMGQRGRIRILLTGELDLSDGGALVVSRGALVGAVVALAHAPDAQDGAGVAVAL